MRALAAAPGGEPAGQGPESGVPAQQGGGGTGIIRRAWLRLPPTIWKRPSCAASAANWNRRAWLEAATSQPVQQVVRGQEKVGRNDPCPCGSGKKFKKCHGA